MLESQIYPQQPAQPTYVQPGLPVPQISPAPVALLTQNQLADLTASIALYPDPLLAAMLPAATDPQEIQEANRWLAARGTPSEWDIQNSPFSTSTETLLHYPTVLQMMAQYPDWTQALGTAFAYQPNDLMDSIQRWRATAQTDGNLVTTAEQRIIVVQPNVIQIVPANPEIIYVPVYDPAIVYVRQRYPRSDYIRFRAVGHVAPRWLDHDVDWRDHRVHVPVVVQRVVTPATPDRRDERDRVGDGRGSPPRVVTPQPRPVTPPPAGRGRDNEPRVVTPVTPAVPNTPQPAPQVEKKIWEPRGIKPGSLVYPTKIVTQDKKVITPAQPPARGRSNDQPARGGNNRGNNDDDNRDNRGRGRGN